MTDTNSKVDAFLTKAKKWREEFEALRAIILQCDLTEDLKWGQPCYTLGKTNVVLIHGFKEYCALLFFKGALLKDAKGVLVQQTENVQAARQLRFTNLKEIEKLKSTIKAYVKEAIKVEQSGLNIEFKKTSEFEVPEEFQTQLNKSSKLKKAFEALTPGRQRAYLLHFSAPKQSKTRESRVEKAIPYIIEGKGLND